MYLDPIYNGKIFTVSVVGHVSRGTPPTSYYWSSQRVFFQCFFMFHCYQSLNNHVIHISATYFLKDSQANDMLWSIRNLQMSS